MNAATKLFPITRVTAAAAVAFALGAVVADGAEAGPDEQGKLPARTDRYGDPLPDGAIARLGTIRLRQSFMASRAVYAPDGKTVLVSGSQRHLHLYDAATGAKVRDYKAPGGDGSPTEFSPDGKMLVIGGVSTSVCIAATGEVLHDLENVAAFLTLGQLRDGTVVAAAVGNRYQLALWDARTGKRLRSLAGSSSPGSPAALSPDGKVLAVGGSDSVGLWDTATGEKLHSIHGIEPPGYARCVRFSPDGKFLAIVNSDQTVRLYVVGSFKELISLSCKDRPGPCSAAFAPSGRELAAGNADGTIAIFELPGGKELRRWRAHSGAACSVNYSPDGRSLVSVGFQENGPSFWDAATGKPLHPFCGHRGLVDQLAYSADGKELFSASGIDQLALRWDVKSGDEIRRFPFSRDKVERVALSPDGRSLATEAGPSTNGTVLVWDVATGKTHALAEKREAGFVYVWPPEPRPLVFSPDGKLLAFHVSNREIDVRDAATGRPRYTLRGQSELIGDLVFSADGKSLASAGWEKGRPVVWVWDLTSFGKARAVECPVSVAHFALSPNGNLLAVSHLRDNFLTSDSLKLRLLDVATGKELFTLADALWGVFGIAFSPDGRYVGVAGGGGGHDVRIWEVATGLQLLRFTGHDPVSLAFSPDCRSLATGGTDATILIWDLTGRASAVRGRPAELSATELEACWTDLIAVQGEPVLRATRDLVDHPRQAVPFLRDRIRAGRPPSAEELARLISRLNDDEFAVREKAESDLAKLGDLAESALRKALKTDPPPETRRRVERILESLTGVVAETDRRSIRAVAVLEYIGNPEARGVLEEVAKGAPGARLTREARAALGRLERRGAGVP